MQSKTYSIIIVSLILFVVLSSPSIAGNVQVSNVTVKNPYFHPSAREEAQISFYLSQDAEVTVTIFDADDSPVRTLGQDKLWFKGVNTVAWNGRDVQDRIVADEAYYFVIEAKDTSGFTARYDPVAFSGGETIHVDPFRRGEHIEYNLPQDSRVRIRIGIHNGPLLKTLLDWAPRKAGQHLETWDGKDDSGLIVVKDLPYSIFIQAFALPENSLITTGSGKDLISYTLISDEESDHNIYSDVPKDLLLKSAKRRTETQNPDRHPHYAMSRIIDRAPRFHLSVDNPGGMMNMKHNPRPATIPTVAGEVSLTLNLDEFTELILADQRYEIIVYVDYQFLFEDEQGSHPYTFELDTGTLTNGQHVVTCNVLSLTDQIGSSSILINVQNDLGGRQKINPKKSFCNIFPIALSWSCLVENLSQEGDHNMDTVMQYITSAQKTSSLHPSWSKGRTFQAVFELTD